MRVKVGDIILDHFSNEIIAQNYEVNSFGNLATRQGGYSNDFKLPLTAKNESTLGFPSDLNTSSRNAYIKVDASLIDVGAVVATGYLRFKVIESGVIKCSFFSDNTEWFNLIKDKKMADLDLSAYNHTWNRLTIVDIIAANKSGGVVYPLIDYGHFKDQATFDCNSDEMYPAMFVHTLVTQIFEDIGWNIDGELPSYRGDETYERMIQPFSAKGFNKSQSDIDDFQTNTNATLFLLIFAVGSVNADLVYTLGFTSPINTLADTDYMIELVLVSTVIITAPTTFTLEIKKNGGVIKTQSYTLIVGANQTNIALDDYTSFLRSDNITVTATSTGGAGGSMSIAGTILMTPSPYYTVGNEIEMKNSMPDMLQSEFLEYIFFSFGIIPQANTFSKTVSLDFFKSIKENIPSVLDWSGKLDRSKKISTDFTQLLGKYSAVSKVNYLEDEDDPELAAYLAETSENFGQGIWSVDNEHLDAEKEIYTAPFAPMININSFSNQAYIPQIKFWDDPETPGTFTREFEPMPKIAIMSNNISVSDLTNTLFATFDITDSTGTSNVSNLPFTWFVKTSYITEIDALTQTLAYDQVQFTNAVGDPMKAEYQQDYVDALSEMKYIKAFFKITEVDINKLDFTLPVYIDEFNSYFYINKIKNYQGSEKTTLVELIKISNV